MKITSLLLVFTALLPATVFATPTVHDTSHLIQRSQLDNPNCVYNCMHVDNNGGCVGNHCSNMTGQDFDICQNAYCHTVCDCECGKSAGC
ncbi:hypothetical protein AN958_08999 [Leucoagaricus sp. SymC.cos]|nr:hypothetical protein AN958_08999 [Leucoagaricus sp. SymC.cos]